MKISSAALLASVGTSAAFAPINNNKPSLLQSPAVLTAETAAASATTIPTKPIFDPLGLYPKNSIERQSGLIQPLESPNSIPNNKYIIDPLHLYVDSSQLSSTVAMSPSLPFLPNPTVLEGTPGNRGFDPFNFSSSPERLYWQRLAEIKHARLAMLASVGWIAAELFHEKMAFMYDMPSMLASGHRVPSVLNDGLAHAPDLGFWMGVVVAAAGLEICSIVEDSYGCKLTPGDWGFDPLNFMGEDEYDDYGTATEKKENRKLFLQESELLNGRLGMLAITGFAFQEWFLNNGVVNQLSHFLHGIV
jgi:hypothetical protein